MEQVYSSVAMVKKLTEESGWIWPIFTYQPTQKHQLEHFLGTPNSFRLRAERGETGICLFSMLKVFQLIRA